MIKWKNILNYVKNGNPEPPRRVEKTDQEWQEILDPEVYRITRQAGTERAFSSEMCTRFEPGDYACACCGNMLFAGDEKYESGSGWPSFTKPIENNAIAYKSDFKLGMRRVETICNVCDAHLGHVFPDGPAPTGLRYCMNALALVKVEE